MEAWQLIFVFFLILMIARIVPRFLRERQRKIAESSGVETNKAQSLIREARPESKDMMVLGEINRGVKTFGNIQKRTGLNSDELNSILESLEKKGLMRVQEKKGVLGIKIELIPTEKGFKEYHS